jgi:hypothetical protein
MNKLNPFYLYLLRNVSAMETFIEVLTPQEQMNDKIRFCVIFMGVDRLASEISRETGYEEDVMHACVALSYTDIYLLTEWIEEEIKRVDKPIKLSIDKDLPF